MTSPNTIQPRPLRRFAGAGSAGNVTGEAAAPDEGGAMGGNAAAGIGIGGVTVVGAPGIGGTTTVAAVAAVVARVVTPVAPDCRSRRMRFSSASRSSACW